MAEVLSRAALLIAATALALWTVDRNQEYRSSLTLAQTAVERYPTSTGRHVLATELIAAGLRDQAVLQLRLALPGEPRAHYTLGMLLFADRRWDEAIRELSAFVQAEPLLIEAVQARLALGKALAKRERWPEAIDQFLAVLSMNPSRAVQIDALTSAALAFINSDHLERAVPLFQRAAAIDPANGVLQHNLANALFDSHDLDGAAVHAQRALELRPDDAQARDLLNEIQAERRSPAAKRPA